MLFLRSNYSFIMVIIVLGIDYRNMKDGFGEKWYVLFL